ncbi:uncharacterized protein [Gossypium hirsutum]|uniref:G-patch domain-containing protein n=1 Tax=Gossypium hirsutum TaxID=3635 RepID=A0ABM3BLD6_GOSHI|nr:uncharacterized protein LOC107889895 [Gossypium hirsutum]
MQVQPPLLEKETTMLFINTLKAPFITHMIGSTTKSFMDIVMAGEMIENAIRDGKIKEETVKRSVPMRKDGEVNNTSIYNMRAITIGQSKTAAVEQQSSQKKELRTRLNTEKMQFTLIPVTYRDLYQSLYDAHAISPFHLKPLFKKAVERLIVVGVVKFDNTPSTENPLPNHGDQGVNAIGETSERRVKEDVAEVRMPMQVIWPEMMKRGMLTSKNEKGEIRNYGEFHEKEGYETQDCKEFKALVQGFIDNKELLIFEGSSSKKQVCVLEDEQQRTSRPKIIISLQGNNEVRAQVVPKVIIYKPVSFPYKDNKRVPWSYNCHASLPEKEDVASTSKDVQIKSSHRRSGKRYDTVGIKEEPIKIINASVEKEKEAEVPVNEPIKEEEAKEFLKEALMKVLNKTYVTHDISINKLDRLVNNISADNFIYFNDDEILPGGKGLTKALHITTRCKGYTLLSVIVDNGSALNVLPLSILNRLPIDDFHMKTCQNVVRAFDGTERKVMGRIDISLEIGPNIYEVDFLMMDIKPSYNCLLGRQWIHLAGAVPSSLYQKLKLVTDGRLVTINAEEDIIAAVTSKAPYVETNEESIECSFRSLEFVNMTFISEGSELLVPMIARATRMALQMMAGKGTLPGRGLRKYLQRGTQIPKLIEKKGHFGLGFKPNYKQRMKNIEKHQERRMARLDGREVGWELMTFPPISKTFISRGLLVEKSHQINAAHNEGSEQRNLEGIRPYESGSSLNNWTDEVKKQFDAGFLQQVKYSEWVANIVSVPKKNGKELMCVATTENCPWKLSFDGASNAVGNGIGAVLISPDGDYYPFTCKLDFDYTNNIA